jgi:two-component system cell cycle sensor histidine kinase/response regulator CckA
MGATTAVAEVTHVLNDQLTVVQSGEGSVSRDRDNADAVILVVDDNPGVRSVVRATLERCGYTVYTAADGDAALCITELFTAPLDLLLTDVVMPRVTGDELVQQLNDAGLLPRVLMMSGSTSGIDGARRRTQNGAVDFIAKPFTSGELATRVREILNEATIFAG